MLPALRAGRYVRVLWPTDLPVTIIPMVKYQIETGKNNLKATDPNQEKRESGTMKVACDQADS